ncbi:MAG: hypothetical protein OZ934_05150 [Anaerolineae bacterium]|nr:hypothetical protein [Anaerolineae bacterium]
MNVPPPKLAFDLERDIRVVAAMASSLTPYLYEDELYGYLAGDLPKLTLGGLLLRLYRLTCLEDSLSTEQQTLLHDARINLEAERANWSVHFENKIRRELRARLEALELFMRECDEDAQPCTAHYPTQAEKRTIIYHLAEEASELGILEDDLRARIRHVDQKLRALLREGEFITDKVLRPAYPPEIFWWLYAYVPELGS